MRRLLCRIGLHSMVGLNDPLLREYSRVKAGLFRERLLQRQRCQRDGCDARSLRFISDGYITELPTQIAPTIRQRIELGVRP